MNNSMVRRQRYITPEQDRALKQQAGERSISEAAVVREALCKHLCGDVRPAIPKYRQQLIDELMGANERIAKHASFPSGYTFNCEEQYANREDRWLENEKWE